MRDRIAQLFTWLRLVLAPQPPRRLGRHSAAHLAEQTTQPEPVSPWCAPWQGPSAATVREIFREGAELSPLQRERWWATAFAEIGIDYDHPTINITPVRGPGVAA
ncbi:hypothetical protein ACIOUE_38215 [Streptomyces xanthochromogenes]|uniref:hypothetical protein n=1 Tax=Streptomyces xanthochromogenes TaxID=67384 RepID=UPI0037FB3286